jgi:hypothetical protein
MTNNFRQIFARYEQVPAAEEAIRWFARYQNAAERHSRTGWLSRVVAPMLFVAKGFTGYADWSTRSGTSVRRLIGCSLLWVIFLFAPVYIVHSSRYLPAESQVVQVDQVASAVSHAAFTFVRLEPSGEDIHKVMFNRDPEFIKDNSRDRETRRNEREPKGGVAAGGFPSNWIAHAALFYRKASLWAFEWSLVFPYRVWLFAELAIAYFTLGLLVSLLYRRVMRHTP